MTKPIILYVDDDKAALDAMKFGLEDRGYDVLQAKGGPEAMVLLKTNSPNLIIADLRMAPMNGFDLFKEVKKNPRFAKTPIFFYTGVDDFLSQKYAESLGVDAYLVKPIDLDTLDSIIRGKLGLP
ncbi:MAG: hypothetical protein AUI33_00680 [Ignavibacteria bacterium 13_1_40CM_2_61_4]|nr:MAG: hypothetical protein AUI33_00680 [Ignavibacteria bacterium 13_1_40CM_2_61_4]